MGLSKPALSKRLDALEKDLGYKLFLRTTRSISPTQNANKLILQVSEIIDRVEELNSDLNVEHDHRKKKIRITCISSMSQRFVGRILKSYQSKHPHLEIELVVTDSVLDPIEHNIDLSIRVNPAKNSSLIGKKIGEYKLLAVATPEYLKKHRKIRKSEDLQHHDLLSIDQHLGALATLPKDVLGGINENRTFKTNDSALVLQLVMDGSGVGIRAAWDVKEAIKRKLLAYALPENTFNPQGHVWIVATKERLQLDVVRNLYDHLLIEISPHLSC
jgi:DNA-binding transcriptional LysR family regulator